jgi:hypothetical protein
MPVRRTPDHSVFLSLCSAILITIALISGGCISAAVPAQHSPTRPSSISDPDSIQKVEIIHFHTDQYCGSCERVGRLSEEAVKSAYGAELSSGKIVYMHIIIDDPANQNVLQKYGATGASLWTGVYDKTGFHPWEDLKVWYLADDTAFSRHVKGVIDDLLAGEPGQS